MLNGLQKLLGTVGHNIATNSRGVVNEVNPFDNGKTFASAWQRPVTSGPGRWYGINGGDQQFVPTRANHAVPLLNVLPPQKSQLQVLPSQSTPDLLQNLSENNGQVTLNGGLIQGSMQPGQSYPTSISPPPINFQIGAPGQIWPNFNNRRPVRMTI